MMNRLRDIMGLRLKATLVVLAGTIVALLIAAGSGIIQVRKLIAADERQTVEAIAQGMAHASELALAVGDQRELAHLTDGFLSNDKIVFVAIYDQSGQLIAHSQRDQAAWDEYSRDHSEGRTFILDRQPVDVDDRSVDFDGAGADMTAAANVANSPNSSRSDSSRRPVGSVVVALSTAPGIIAQQDQEWLTAASSAVAAALTVIGMFIFVARWTSRLKQLVAASERISSGDLSQSVCDPRHDEIGRLAHAYERMRQAVQQRDNDLRQFNDTLQQQVEDRTHSLEEALRAAEAADRAKSLFLANMSHEIRTPLNGVVGMIDLLRGTNLDESQSRFAGVARSSADALLNVINDILDFSKIEAGRMELEWVEMDLASVIENVAETAAVFAARKGLEIGCFIHPKTPDTVLGDPSRLGQVLMNLVNNAIKFTETGQVIINASPVKEDENQPVIRFTVTDSGIGIPTDRVERLFKSFSQIDASTTRKYGGSGLGLAISKRLVEMMGGQIGVQSEPGKGSTFWFELPMTPVQPGAAQRSEEQIIASLRHLKILAVDDNPVNLEIIQKQLAAWNLDVEIVNGGAPALQKLRAASKQEKAFDLAIMDWHMPGLDGVGLAQAIRSTPEIKETALIMLTSVDDCVLSQEIQALGFAGYLVKPVRQSRLLDTIAEAIGKRLSAGSTGGASAAAKSEQQPEIQKPRQGVGHILLAEDNEINRMVASEILRRSGYTFDVVGNGQAALDAAFAKQFDLILMDCQMPGMDGFESTRAIRDREKATGAKRRIPIVALTANAIKGDREACLAAGMDNYVPKPINPEHLIEIIASHIGNRPAPIPPPADAASPAAKPAAGPVDMAAFLERCLGNPQVAFRVLDVFAVQATEEIARLQRALAEGNLERLSRLAHSLKGSASNISADSVRKVARELEKLAAAGDFGPLAGKLDELKTELERCMTFIAEVNRQPKSATAPFKPRDAAKESECER
jgi:signal transduction histidine kinase/DNA-binding response OmpR family regulator